VQELSDRRASLVFVGLGRHRQPCVVGEQCDDGADVAVLDRVRELPNHLALAPGVRQRRAFAPGSGQAALKRDTGASQQAVHCGFARVEDLGCLRGAEAEHVAQN
jgi:hypothetical protein